MVELRRKAKQLKVEKSFSDAVEIYSQIYSDDCDNWIGWEYAYCLKKLGKIDEAIDICKTLYYKDKNFKHNNDLFAWLIFEKYFKNTKVTYSHKEVDQLFDIAVFISKIVSQDKTSPYEKIMLKTLKILKNNSNKPDNNILYIIEKLDSKKLSEIPPIFRHSNREREYQSDKEMFYVYKTKAMYNKKFYYDCIECCKEALTVVSKFHHSNDIWIESRIALCLGEIESVDKAIEKLKELSSRKMHWTFYDEIAQLYQSKNDNKNALLYFCRAAITSDAPQMKVTLYYEMSMLINTMGDSSIANLHVLFAKNIREIEGWIIPTELFAVIDKISESEKTQNVCIETLQEYWINKIYEILGKLGGYITNVNKDYKFGFVKSGKKSYYFKTISILGRHRVKQNDKVTFCIVESFDKKKNQRTNEAVYIKLDK